MAQEIDPDLFAQLSEEQIETAKEMIKESSIQKEPEILELPELEESLMSIDEEETNDEVGVKKFGYDFFCFIFVS